MLDFEDKLKIAFVAFVFLVLISWPVVIPIFKANTKGVATFTITEKGVKRSNDSDRYLIYTEEEVFQNTDQLLVGKFNSSDLYSELKEGKTYTCETTGFRNQFFSWYRNLIKCEENHETN